ncbi:MAG TPA: phage integrase SAM-like domain-containing protein, partial [Cyclobacteriaceae bacterium]|nr:phage integrase SAM-like domain-containing protein [Cyclobacteriaceae bacterium]
MEKDIFKITLKPGTSKTALAFIVAYHKAFKGHRFMFSTGLEVTRRSFDPARPGKALKDRIGYAEDAVKSLNDEKLPINNISLKERIELIINRYQWQGHDLVIWTGSKVERFTLPEGVNKEEVNKRINQELQKDKPSFTRLINDISSKGANSLFGFWQKVIDGKVKAKSGKPLTKNTLKAKRQTLEILMRYQEHAGITLNFDSMNMMFYQDFMQWQETVGKEWTDKDGKLHRGPYDINSQGKNIKDIKAILNLARANEYFEHDKFSRWPIPKEKNEVVALTKDELLRINSLDLTGTKADVRDIFILAAFLGPRISDFKAFKSESLSTKAGITFFEYVQEKTGELCKIPV